MISAGDIVKLKNPRKKGEAKRRWRVKEIKQEPDMEAPDSALSYGYVSCIYMRRLDTVTHRLERNNEYNLVPVSFWEKIWKRY